MKVIGHKTLWEGSFIKTVLVTYRDRRGTERQWEAVDRVNCSGVVVVIPVTENDELLLIRQYRPILDNYVIELPAGLVGPGEDNVSAGRRELIEETGHDSDRIIQLTGGVMSTGINAEKWEVLLALQTREAPKEVLEAHKPDESEDIEVIKAPFSSPYDTIESFVTKGDLADLRIFGLVELARRSLRTL
jgi:8-oxo-dGTP pyrophosphatase MutT (NUDIX family)